MFVTVVTMIAICFVAAGVGWLSSKWGYQRTLAMQYEQMSKCGISVPRHPGEDLPSWASRIRAAQDELWDATTEFLGAAQREGTVEQISERGKLSSLPSDHPAAIRLRRAQGREVAEDKREEKR
jgi:hypothetical protein